MIYYELSNIIDNTKDISKYAKYCSVSKYYDFGYKITWLNRKLWGKSIDGNEFVMYSKIRVGEPIPNELKQCFLGVKYFEIIGSNIVCKYIGRYIGEIDGKKWVLDVIFKKPKTLNVHDERNFLKDTIGVYSNWVYDFLDTNMIDFVMEKIERLEPEDRSIINILRMLMCQFSSVNSNSGLIEGKWGGSYSGGIMPTEWKYPSEIFLKWQNTKKPVKYGQCWVYAECMTICLRFLGIPTKTIFATNSHINPALKGYVNFFENESFMKGVNDLNHENDECFFRTINPIKLIKINNKEDEELEELGVEKGDIFDDCKIYSTGDSMWNIHYWNEILISRDNIRFEWEVLDSCPYLESKNSPYKNKKILGPSKINSIKNGTTDFLYDYNYLHATVNSPFMIWINETTVFNGEVITIPFVHSIVYPFHKEKSIMVNNDNVKKLLKKEIRLETVSNKRIINVTSNYVMPFKNLYRFLIENNPIIFHIVNSEINNISDDSDEDIYYVQQIVIDNKNVISKIRRQNCMLKNVISVKYKKSSDSILSILIVKGEEFWVQLIKL